MDSDFYDSSQQKEEKNMESQLMNALVMKYGKRRELFERKEIIVIIKEVDLPINNEKNDWFLRNILYEVLKNKRSSKE